MKLGPLAWGLLALFLCASTAAAGERVVVYPRAEASDDARLEYPVAVLALALEHAHFAHRLQPSPLAMPQSRSLRLLERGELLDVAWSAATAERSQRLRAVEFPIDRGLLGWRVLLVREAALARLHAVRSLEDLRALSFGLGHDWPDTEVLRANGLTVVPGSDYLGLFRMLAAGRIDAFPRALSEARPELQAHADLGLAIEPALLLHYPAALYFHVARGDEELALALQRGLEAALADASLRALFDAHYGADLQALAPATRTRVELQPAAGSARLPLARAELWYTPDEH